MLNKELVVMVGKLVLNLLGEEQTLNITHHLRLCHEVIDELLHGHLSTTNLNKSFGDQFNLPQVFLWYLRQCLLFLFPGEVLAVKVLYKVEHVYHIVEDDDK